MNQPPPHYLICWPALHLSPPPLTSQPCWRSSSQFFFIRINSWSDQRAHGLFTVARLTPLTSTGVKPRSRNGNTHLTTIDLLSLDVSLSLHLHCHPRSPSHHFLGPVQAAGCSSQCKINANRSEPDDDSPSHLRLIYRGSTRMP